MNLPGFTAEASLRRADTPRRAAPGVTAAAQGGGRIVPQIGVPRISCEYNGTLVNRDGTVDDYICCNAYGARGCFFARRV